MAVENMKEVIEYINTNKESNDEVKNYLGGLVNADSVNTFLNGDNGRSIVDSLTSKAIEAYKGKGMQKEIEKAVKEAEEKLRLELNPTETPEQKRIRELEDKYAKAEADSLAKELKLQTNSLFADKKYDISLSKFINGNSIEEIEKQADELNVLVQNVAQKLSDEKLSGTFKAPSNTGGAGTAITKEQFASMGYTERVKLASDNPDLYKQLTE